MVILPYYLSHDLGRLCDIFPSASPSPVGGHKGREVCAARWSSGEVEATQGHDVLTLMCFGARRLEQDLKGGPVSVYVSAREDREV